MTRARQGPDASEMGWLKNIPPTPTREGTKFFLFFFFFITASLSNILIRPTHHGAAPPGLFAFQQGNN